MLKFKCYFKKIRKLDYLIFFSISLFVLIIQMAAPLSYVAIIKGIFASILFAAIWGSLTNFLFSKKQKN